jgi:hypothetical protein
MKKHLNAKNITIVILIILLFLVFLNPGGHLPTRTKYVPKIDSVEYAIHDTVTVDSLVEVEVEVEVPVEVEVEKIVEVPVYQTIDTMEILKVHFAKVQHKEVLTLPNNATLESQVAPPPNPVPSFTPNLPIEDVSAIDVFPDIVLRAA